MREKKILNGSTVLTYFGGDKIPSQTLTVVSKNKAVVTTLLDPNCFKDWFYRIGEVNELSLTTVDTRDIMQLDRITIVARKDDVVTAHYLFKKY